MLISESLNRKIPDYYPTMYLDGYTPDEIMYALHKKADRQLKEQWKEENAIDTINVNSVVKIKK